MSVKSARPNRVAVRLCQELKSMPRSENLHGEGVVVRTKARSVVCCNTCCGYGHVHLGRAKGSLKALMLIPWKLPSGPFSFGNGPSDIVAESVDHHRFRIDLARKVDSIPFALAAKGAVADCQASC